MYKKFLLLTAFISGMVVMAVEISASRLLAPYFGTSIFVWTNIIGIIMLALSIGYYWGGILADKKPRIELLLKIILAACIIFIIIPFLVKPLSYNIIQGLQIERATASIFLGSLISVTILFSIPLMLLGMVSPFVIKLLTHSQENVGRTLGAVFALSTLGSLIGTFLSVLVFIPWIGTKNTIILFSLILMFCAGLGLLLIAKFFKTKLLSVLFIPMLVIPFGTSNYKIKNNDRIIFDDESAYQYIQVVDNGETRYMMYNEAGGIQSIYNPQEILTDHYYDYFSVLPLFFLKQKDLDVAILGLSGGTISRQYDFFYKDKFNLKIDGVEIDQKVIDAAKEYFFLENNSLTVHNMDGRIFLNTAAEKYDIIIIDAYSNEMYIPFHLSSKEFFDLVSKKLKDNGIMAINVNSTTPQGKLLKAFGNTIAKVFDYTYLIPVKSWNYMIIASNEKIDFENLNQDLVEELFLNIKNLQDNKERVTFEPKAMVLTDDKASTELLTEKMYLDYFTNN